MTLEGRGFTWRPLSFSTIRDPLLNVSYGSVLIQVDLPSRFFGEAGLATLGFLLFEYIKVDEKGGS